MKKMCQVQFVSCILVVLFACGKKTTNEKPIKPEVEYYTNPVFEPVLADPSVLRAGNVFYAYGTEDDWGEEGGYHLVPIIKSNDLINWKVVGDAFEVKPNWIANAGIWAPNVMSLDGKYYMYYSYSTWGDPNPGIGLAIADTPEGPFIDQGKLFDSEQIGVDNSIDPFVYEDNGKLYMFWGSFRGIYAIELSSNGKSIIGEKIKIANNHLEASYIYKRNGFYYFFGSSGSCCDGINSSYHVLVGRSQSLLGPYLDKQGNRLLDGHYGELVVQSNAGDGGFVGPGHNAEIITDNDGNDWFIYHGMKKSLSQLNNGTNRRTLLVDKINWERDWPMLPGQEPSIRIQLVPNFND